MPLDLQPAHFRGDLVQQIADAVLRLSQSKKQHPILICGEAHLPAHPALEPQRCFIDTIKLTGRNPIFFQVPRNILAWGQP